MVLASVTDVLVTFATHVIRALAYPVFKRARATGDEPVPDGVS